MPLRLKLKSIPIDLVLMLSNPRGRAMKRKITNLMWALASLIAVNQVFAQSSHDVVSGADADFMGNTSKFDIASPDGRFKLEFAGHLQQRNEFTYDTEAKEKDLQI